MEPYIDPSHVDDIVRLQGQKARLVAALRVAVDFLESEQFTDARQEALAEPIAEYGRDLLKELDG